MDLHLRDLEPGYPETGTLARLTGSFSGPGLHLVLGRSGTGKSTLLCCLAGLLAPLRGEVVGSAPGIKISLSFQEPETLFFNRTVGDEVCFALLRMGLNQDQARERGMTWLSAWGLDPVKFWNRDPFRLSGGEKRLAGLAVSTVVSAGILLFDEPLAGLDLPTRMAVGQVLSRLAADHLIVVVTNDPELFFPMARSVLLIEAGLEKWFPSGREFLASAGEGRTDYPLRDY